MTVAMRPWATNAFLNECFSYDENSGLLSWRERPLSHFKSLKSQKSFNTRHGQKICECLDSHGYIFVRISRPCGNTYSFRGHRIIWAIINDINLDDAPCEIDHIDLNKSNNRRDNLRAANPYQNHQNVAMRSHNTSGVKGVCFDIQNNKWRARITSNGIRYDLGIFNHIDDALKARLAAQKLHGEFGRMQ